MDMQHFMFAELMLKGFGIVHDNNLNWPSMTIILDQL